MSPRIHIETYGCQMNDYESDRTYRRFHDERGYTWTDDPAEADLVIYNTCSIREKADQKAMSSLGRLRVAKQVRPEMVIAVGGCSAQSMGEDILRRAPFVDVVFGTHQWESLPEKVDQAARERKGIVDTEFFGWRDYSFLPYRASKLCHPVSELVTIQNGCDKFCTFCVVPFTRGREVSRSHSEIVTEVRAIVSRGAKEVTLLGQNVNAYGTDRSGEISFSELLDRVGDTEGLERIRFMTSHPAVFSEATVDAMARNSKVCEHLHLPIQSGSDRVLNRMNRGHTVEEYREKVNYLLRRIPGIAITTDIIIGFPSETEKDFEQTMDVVREFGFEDSYSFCFSPRPHTKAEGWVEEFVPSDIASRRLIALQALQDEIRDEKMRERLGTVEEVLVEGESKLGGGRLSGRTRSNRVVNFVGPKDLTGSLVDVRITECRSHTYGGEL